MAVDHDEIIQRLATIETKIDGIIARQDYANGRTGKLESKLIEVESWRENISGKISIIAGLVSIAISIITALIIKHFS